MGFSFRLRRVQSPCIGHTKGLPGRFVSGFLFIVAAVKDGVHHGNKKKGHEGTDSESSYKGLAYGLNSVGPYAGEEGNRGHGEHGGEAGHQYRAQAAPARFKTGFIDT